MVKLTPKLVDALIKAPLGMRFIWSRSTEFTAFPDLFMGFSRTDYYFAVSHWLAVVSWPLIYWRVFVHLTTNCWYDMVVVRAGWGFNITSTWQSFVICHRGFSRPWWLCVTTATNTFLMNYVQYIYISKATLSWQYQSSKIIDKRTYTKTNTLPKVSLAALGQIMDRQTDGQINSKIGWWTH